MTWARYPGAAAVSRFNFGSTPDRTGDHVYIAREPGWTCLVYEAFGSGDGLFDPDQPWAWWVRRDRDYEEWWGSALTARAAKAAAEARLAAVRTSAHARTWSTAGR